MAFNSSYYWERLKLLFKMMGVGMIAILALGIGFLITIVTFIIAPIFAWWKLRNIDSDVDVVKKGDFIDVEYEIVEEDKDKEEKDK
jgi:hypothetical protein